MGSGEASPWIAGQLFRGSKSRCIGIPRVDTDTAASMFPYDTQQSEPKKAPRLDSGNTETVLHTTLPATHRPQGIGPMVGGWLHSLDEKTEPLQSS